LRIYFDTAYIAKCYLNEPDAKEVRQAARKATGLYSSAWCVLELACVFRRQVREHSINEKQVGACRNLFLEDVRNGVWNLFPVPDRLLYRAEALVADLPSKIYLRAGDAIHLISAQEAGFSEIWTNDRHLLAAARYFGLSGKSI